MADRQSTAIPPDVEDAILRDIQKMEETEFVLDFVDKSRRHRQKFEPIWDEVLDNYMQTLPSERANRSVPYIGSPAVTTARSLLGSAPRGSYGSELKDPETNQIVDSLAAQGIALMMPTMEFIQVIPIGMDDPPKARYLARLLQGILQAPGNYGTNFLAFKDGFLFGTAILEIGWETRSRLQVVQKPVFNENGFLVGTDSDVAEVVYRDHPLLRPVDIYDFFPDPSGTRIQEDMLGVVKRFRISAAQASRMAEAKIYSKEGVRKAMDARKNPEDQPDPARFPGIPKDTADKYRMLTGFEFWGEYPGTRPPDGARNRVITVLEGFHVRSHINSYLDGNIPFKEIVLNPISGRFYGLSAAEVVRHLQDSIDGLLMVFTDAADLAARNVVLAGHAWGGNVDQLKRRIPNDVIRCANPDAVKPLEMNLNALQFAQNEIARRKMNAREGSGATNPLQAIPSGSDRQTATEVSELVRLASQRVDLMVQLVEREDYPWIGQTLHSRMRQFLSPERQAILAGERFPVTLEDIDFEADVRFVGSRESQSKFQKAATLREAINVLGTNPGIVQLLPDLVLRYLRDGLDIRDAEQIVADAVQRLQVQQQATSMMAGGMGNQAQNAENGMGATAGETSMEGMRLA